MQVFKEKIILMPMYEKDLHEKFVSYLHVCYPRKRELISLLTDILILERESVSRRLNGKVLFTVNEIGKVARCLNVSIDRLLEKNQNPPLFPLNLIMPLRLESIDVLIEQIDKNKEKLKCVEEYPFEVGHIFDSLPVEYFMSYTYLCKFMYFKWAYFFVGNNSFKDYNTWRVPLQIYDYHDELIKCWNNYDAIFYIWDNPVIWNLVGEINLFYKMRILNEKDVALIKKDLHDLLDDVEMRTKETGNGKDISKKNADLYISSVNIGVTCIYFQSPEISFIHYKPPFALPALYKDAESFNLIYDWINSMKRVSTLVSGSGAVERRIFFDKQHEIVEKELSLK